MRGYAPETHRLDVFSSICDTSTEAIDEDDWQLPADFCEEEEEDLQQKKLLSEDGHSGQSSLNTSKDSSSGCDDSPVTKKSQEFAGANGNGILFSQMSISMLTDEDAVEEAEDSSNGLMAGAAEHEEHEQEHDMLLDVSLSSIGLDFVSVDE